MARQAKGAEVVEVALATAFGDGQDVVGVPKRAPGADGTQPPQREELRSRFAARALQLAERAQGICRAQGAEAFVAGEDLLAEVARVGAEPPLVHAEVGAEGAAAASQDLELAPTAQRASTGAER